MELMHDVLLAGKGVGFHSSDDVMEMLRHCEQLGLLWAGGEKAIEYVPDDWHPFIFLTPRGRLRCGDAVNYHDWCPNGLVEWRTINANQHGVPMFRY